MKVKLLKKVRKRFVITKWEKIDNPGHWLYGSELPLFVVSDEDDSFGYSNQAYKNYEDAYSYLVAKIRLTYYATMKRDYNKRNAFKKVWFK